MRHHLRFGVLTMNLFGLIGFCLWLSAVAMNWKQGYLQHNMWPLRASGSLVCSYRSGLGPAVLYEISMVHYCLYLHITVHPKLKFLGPNRWDPVNSSAICWSELTPPPSPLRKFPKIHPFLKRQPFLCHNTIHLNGLYPVNTVWDHLVSLWLVLLLLPYYGNSNWLKQLCFTYIDD